MKPSFEAYILPSKQYADIIVPRGADNLVAIDVLLQHIRLKLMMRTPRVAGANSAASMEEITDTGVNLGGNIAELSTSGVRAESVPMINNNTREQCEDLQAVACTLAPAVTAQGAVGSYKVLPGQITRLMTHGM